MNATSQHLFLSAISLARCGLMFWFGCVIYKLFRFLFFF